MQIIKPSSTLAPTPINAQAEVTAFLIDNFEAILAGIDASPLTRQRYTKAAADFIAHVEEDGLNLNTYRSYKAKLSAEVSITAKTKNIKLTAAKTLLKELHQRHGVLKVDLTAGVKQFSVTQEHVKDGLTADEVQAVRTVIDNLPAAKRYRLQAIFFLLAFQGLRQFEVCALTAEDLRLSDKVAFVRGKGRDSKDRIDLHPDTAIALQKYIAFAGIKSGNLFPGANGDALTTRAMRKLFTCPIYGLFKKAGLDLNRSLHGFRHFFVTRFLEITSGDVLTVQQFSRHRSLQALKMYDDRKRKQELLPTFYTAFS